MVWFGMTSTLGSDSRRPSRWRRSRNMRLRDRLALGALIAAVSAVVGVGTLAPMLKHTAPPEDTIVATAAAPPRDSPVAPTATAAPVVPPRAKAAVANLTEPVRPTPRPEPVPAPPASAASAFPPMQPLTDVPGAAAPQPAAQAPPPPIVAATDRPGTAEKAARPRRTADSRPKPRKRAVRPQPFTIEDLFAGRPFPIR